jgi:pyruvate/2-oxoglutarate dehydrogenase complex dihydrolipoamide dehydrogenase (E3) component
VPYLTNSSLLDLEVLPEHLIILGGGYVGVEFCQMYRRFGSNVTIVDHAPRLMSSEDEDASRGIGEIFEREGIEVVSPAKIEEIASDGSGIRVTIGEDGGQREIRGSHFLVAAGRTPNTDDLGLETTAIETDKKGYVQVDDRLQTDIDGIFAMGDCNGRGAFTHTSYKTMRSWRPTCWTATRAASATASPPMPPISTRRSRGSARARATCVRPAARRWSRACRCRAWRGRASAARPPVS